MNWRHFDTWLLEKDGYHLKLTHRETLSGDHIWCLYITVYKGTDKYAELIYNKLPISTNCYSRDDNSVTYGKDYCGMADDCCAIEPANMMSAPFMQDADLLIKFMEGTNETHHRI